ncbi:MAG: hypothetical protein D6733_00885 [Methanobacteriota archaeon]|nr:MAG: hypothetical protein D6733_00885 [Euryarchaeota archaeon]
MEAWKKGAVTGGVWGLVVGILKIKGVNFGLIYLKEGCTEALIGCVGIAPLYYLLYLPLLIAFYIARDILGLGFILLYFAYPIAILIGALIGSIIGFTVDKYNQRRVAL